MTGRTETLQDLYRAFNDRDLEAAGEHLHPDIDWMDEASGGWIHGRAAVRRLWESQWKAGDPRIEPLAITADGGTTADARVHELVRAADGTVVENRRVVHRFTFDGAFIRSMTVIASDPGPGDEDDEDE